MAIKKIASPDGEVACLGWPKGVPKAAPGKLAIDDLVLLEKALDNKDIMFSVRREETSEPEGINNEAGLVDLPEDDE